MNKEQISAELRKMLTDFTYTEQIILSMKWQKTESVFRDWNLRYPMGCNYLFVTFPEKITDFPSAFVQTVLMNTGFLEEWGEDYFPETLIKRKKFLYAWKKNHNDFLRFCFSLEQLRLRPVDGESVFSYISGVTPKSEQDAPEIEKDLLQLQPFLSRAYCIETGGFYPLDYHYLCIDENHLLDLNCGIWD